MCCVSLCECVCVVSGDNDDDDNTADDGKEEDCYCCCCCGRVADEERAAVRRDVAFDVVVMVVCILSCLLCLRSLGRAWQLKRVSLWTSVSVFFFLFDGKSVMSICSVALLCYHYYMCMFVYKIE